MTIREYVANTVLLPAQGDFRYVFNSLGDAGPHPFDADWSEIPELEEAFGEHLSAERHKDGAFEFFLGPALSGAYLHGHGAAYNALVSGRKRWVRRRRKRPPAILPLMDGRRRP